jgi:hypothetical protein
MAGLDLIGAHPTDAEPAGPERVGRRRRVWPDSAWPLVGVALAFLVVELLFVARKPGLGWDEIVYASQINSHAAAAPFVAARSRGLTLLVAPVTYFTTSTLALRVYLSCAAAIALFGVMWLWRRLVPGWVVAGAALFFTSLWVVQYYSPRAQPEVWVALSGLAACGFFLRAVGCGQCGPGGTTPQNLPQATATSRLLGKRDLTGLAGALACAALMRPGDAVFLSVPLLVAALSVRSWRHWQVIVTMLAGLIAGCVEWVIEAYVRFGGPLSRLHRATAQQGGFGLHAGIWDELRALNGPVICRGSCLPRIGLSNPWLTFWWLALPVLAVLGILAARRAGRLGPSLLATACAFSAGLQYLFLLNFGAPRFLIPMYALLAIPVAEFVGWLLQRRRRVPRILVAFGVAICIALQLVSQHGVLTRVVGNSRTHDAKVARELHALGVRAPCLAIGDQFIPFAYFAGCASATSPQDAAPGETVVVIEPIGDSAPSYAHYWDIHMLTRTGYIVYIKPQR